MFFPLINLKELKKTLVLRIIKFLLKNYVDTQLKEILQGFITVRIWFPKLQGVVMMSDQEVIIMCKPVDQTVERWTTEGFAGLL